jgi:hypothetical protein
MCLVDGIVQDVSGEFAFVLFQMGEDLLGEFFLVAGIGGWCAVLRCTSGFRGFWCRMILCVIGYEPSNVWLFNAAELVWLRRSVNIILGGEL